MVWERKGKVEERERFVHEAMTYFDHLYRVAFHLVKGQDEAQDFVQETYVRALSSYEQFTPGTNMKAWLTRILYNFFFDQYHQKKRWVSVEEEDSEGWGKSDYWEKVPTENPGPEGHILLNELNAKITDALRKIPEDYRMSVILVDMRDFSYAETAEIISCPVGTVRSRLSRGRRLLHNQLKRYVDTHERE